MTEKSIAVLGLGRFGRTIALELSKAGMEVLVVDIDREKINDISNDVTCAIQADVKDLDTMKSIGISNMDAVAVCMTDDLEASILSIIKAKELGVPYVLAKAKNQINMQVLLKVGADKVVFPEMEEGVRIAKHLASESIIDYLELTDKVSIVEIKVKDEWVGRSLLELNLRKKYKINVVGIKYNDDIIVNIDPEEPIQAGAELVVIGDNERLNKF